MPERRSLRSRSSLTSQVSQIPASRAMARPRRTVSGNANQSVTVARETSRSPDDAKKSIRLTVKMPSSKLREATSGSSPVTAASSRDHFDGGDTINGSRGSRAKRSIVVESESDEEEEEEEEEEVEEEVIQSDDEQQEEEDEEQEEDGEEEEEEDEEEEDDVEEAEDESVDAVAGVDADTDPDADADGDIDMEDAPILPHPPILKMNGPAQKPSLTITPAQGESDGAAAAAAAKEMDLADDDDEELSELDSENEEEEAEDAEGEDVGEMDEMDQEDEGRSQQAGSRASTPDVSKMTKRQRSRLDQVMGSDFLQLPMEPQIKKHLTAEEHAMRRAEMARRRKNLSEKRNEEEKMDTINRLLKKQAPKRRGKISAAELSANAAAHEDLGGPEVEIEKPNPVYVRWVSNRHGCRAGVPGEWLAGPSGRFFGLDGGNGNRGGGGGGGGNGIEVVEGG